jgi:hypothetical protein
MTSWTQAEALELAKLVEAIAEHCGAHVALTGGCLYKDGKRKDCDLLFYRVRQVDRIDTEKLFKGLDKAGLYLVHSGDFGWCVKAGYRGKPIDLLFPERDGEIQGCQDPEISRRLPPSADFEFLEDDILA